MMKFAHFKRFLNLNLQRQSYKYSTYLNAEMSLNVPITDISTLNNGLRIVSENWNTRTSTVGMWIDVGSRYETASNNGVAHFLEHMAFKGTDKRTQQSLELEVENKGAHLNAYTSREMTVFYAKCLNKDIEWAVELLADILRNSKFDRSLIDRERGVILREMEEIESTYQEVVFDYLHAAAYQKSSLGQTILGPENNIRSLSQKDLRSFIDNHYHANKMVLTAVGGVNHAELTELGNKYWGNLRGDSDSSSGSRSEGEIMGGGAVFSGCDIRQSNDRMPHAHVAIAVQGPGWIASDTVALMVAASVNGAWDRNHAGMGQATSRLATAFFAEGSVNSFQNFFTCYHDTSLWGIYLTCEGGGLRATVDAVIAEWRRICTSITEEEVSRAKKNLQTNLLMQLDGTTPVCEEIGRHMVTYGRRIPPEEMIHRIESVSAAEVRAVCSKYVRNTDPASASVGPIKDLPDYEHIKAAFHW